MHVARRVQLFHECEGNVLATAGLMVEQKLRLCYKCCTRDVARVELICDMIQVVLRLRDTKWGVVRTPNTITRNGQSQLITATKDRAQIDRHFMCIHNQKGIGYLV